MLLNGKSTKVENRKTHKKAQRKKNEEESTQFALAKRAQLFSFFPYKVGKFFQLHFSDSNFVSELALSLRTQKKILTSRHISVHHDFLLVIKKKKS